ncbi:hypothetical protein BGW37DRAFT_483407 [Umbelopsis sp. PMI_123]|nr:hypothetical protein BGW37DRAFT_483407 [Umbelopsis sp. PMI_123]
MFIRWLYIVIMAHINLSDGDVLYLQYISWTMKLRLAIFNDFLPIKEKQLLYRVILFLNYLLTILLNLQFSLLSIPVFLA